MDIKELENALRDELDRLRRERHFDRLQDLIFAFAKEAATDKDYQLIFSGVEFQGDERERVALLAFISTARTASEMTLSGTAFGTIPDVSAGKPCAECGGVGLDPEALNDA
jgi:hypothetical protein